MVQTLTKAGNDFVVNINTGVGQFEPGQSKPSISRLNGGGFVVSWTNLERPSIDIYNSDVKAQLFSFNGTKIGSEFLVNTQTAEFQGDSATAGLSDGGFVVTWSDYSLTLGDASFSSIKAQLFSAAGAKVGSEFLVNTQTASAQLTPMVTGLSNGGFVVSWADSSGTLGDASSGSIKAQVFDALGVKVGAEFLVNTQAADRQASPTITGLSSGGFVVSWIDFSGTLGDASGFSIKAQVFSASGIKVGTEFLVNTQTSSDQAAPTITGLSSGGFVASWCDYSPLGDGSGTSIKAQLFSAEGAKIGSEFLVNTQTAGNQFAPSVAEVSNGSFAVTWVDIGPTTANLPYIKTQLFSATGEKLGAELVNYLVRDFEAAPRITGLTNGDVFVSWHDVNRTVSGKDPSNDVFAQRLRLNNGGQEDPTQSFIGTLGVDVFAVSDDNGWTISGLGGTDTLTGGTKTDVIIGGKGNDELAGGGGNDEFRVGFGDGVDIFDGGSGFDRIFATANDVKIGISSLSGIEAISSDGFVGVAIIGNADANVLDFSGTTLTGISYIDARGGNDDVTGSAGNDVFELGGGNDIIKGGEADDVFIARPLNGRDSVDGGAGYDRIVAGADDTKISLANFSGIEEISGDGFAGVTLVGTSGADTMDYSGVTLSGIEAISGLGGKDVITGSAGDDRIIGGGGGDTLTGGAGADVFAYALVTESPKGLNADVITDFVSGQDRIDLSGIDAVANAVLAGNQEFTFIGTDAFTGLGQLRIGVDANGNTALFGNVSGNLTADFQISFLGAPSIQPADIIL